MQSLSGGWGESKNFYSRLICMFNLRVLRRLEFNFAEGYFLFVFSMLH